MSQEKSIKPLVFNPLIPNQYIIDDDVDFIGAPLAGGWRGLFRSQHGTSDVGVMQE